LIGYNAISSFGSPSYYAQKMFGTYLGDKVVSISGENIPTQTRKPTKRDSIAGKMPKPIPALFYVATQDAKTGSVYLKVVNASGIAQAVNINLDGVKKVAPQATVITLRSDKPEDTNTIDEPGKIKPAVTKAAGIQKSFTRTFEPYSITVVQLNVL
jgi:alpha-N-arabinofuranosidase